MTTCMTNLQNGATSDVRSLNSNNYMPPQRSKISIGILVENSLKIVPGVHAISETVSKLPGKHTIYSFHGKSVNENEELDATSNRENKISEMRNKISEKWVHKGPGDHSISAAEVVQHFPTKGFTSLMRAGINKKSDCLTDAENNEHLNMEDKSTLTSKNERYKVTKDAEQAETIAKFSHEDLRMKLLDILGSGPSGNKQMPSLQLPNGSAEVPEQGVLREEQNGKIEKSIPSDPIESNSESQNNAACGPFTRSSAQKHVTKNQPVCFQPKSSVDVRKLSPVLSKRKTKLGKNHVFSFDGVSGAGRSKMHETECNKIKQNTTRNISQIRPRRISFSKKPVSFKGMQESEKKQASSPPRSTSIGSEAGTPGFNLPEKSVERQYTSAKSFANLKQQPCMLTELRKNPISRSDSLRDTASPCNPKMENQGPSDAIPKIDSTLQSECQISLKSSSLDRNIGANMKGNKPYLQDDRNKLNINKGPESSRHSNDHEKVTNYSQTSGKRHPFHEFPSPTLAGNLSPTMSTENSTERSDSPILDQKMSSPEASDQKTNSQNSKLQSLESDTESKDSEGSVDSLMKRTSIPVNGKPQPQKGVQETEKLEANDLSSKDCTRRKKWFLDVDYKEKSPFTLWNRKRPRLSEVKNANNLDTPAAPFLDTLDAEEDERCEVPGQFQEDCLPMAVSQLMRVVEKLQTKLKSKEKKKNSEILSSVADRLHSQMLDIESQIQADVKKFTGLARSKRKHLEATFEAQQEKLKSLHEKFKAELNQHLQDCRVTFEELEAFQEELKGNIDMQKASQRKLLLKVEEEMKVQLSDAETSITTIQKVARKKMNGLKHVLSEWLNEVALS